MLLPEITKKIIRILKKLSWDNYIIIIIGLLLLSYIIVRAKLLSFVHDESYNYLNHASMSFKDIILFNGPCPGNSHLLGTILQKCSDFLFRNNELALRSPNIAAYVLYLVSSFLIIKNIKNSLLRIISFLLLNFNQFILDFFSLTRGYGLGLGFQLLCIFLFLNALKKDRYFEKRDTFLITLFAGISVFANFVFLNFYVAIILCIFLTNMITVIKRFYHKESLLRVIKRMLRGSIFLFLNTLVLFSIITGMLLKLKRLNQFYYGGDKNFIEDTLKSLVEATLYRNSYQNNIILYITIVIIFLGVFSFFYSIIKNLSKNVLKIDIFLLAITLLTFFCIVSVVLQHYILGTKYLWERTGIFFIPLFVLISIFTFNSLVLNIKNRIISLFSSLPLIIIFLFVSFNFYKSLNLTHTYTWQYDADTKDMMLDLKNFREQKHDTKEKTIATNWIFQPSILFYRKKYSMDWLLLDHFGLEKELCFDYYFYTPEQEPTIKYQKRIEIKQYSITKNKLEKGYQ